MKAVPDPHEGLAGAGEGADLRSGEEAGVLEALPSLEAEEGPGGPEHVVDVPETASTLLHVGLEEPDRIPVALVAPVPVGGKGAGEFGPPALESARKPLGEALVRAGVPSYEAHVEERDLEEEVGGGVPEGLFHGPHAVAELEALVPEGVEEPPGRLLGPGGRSIMEDHEVQVREREELSSAVAPKGDEGEPRGARLFPESADEGVHRQGMLLEKRPAFEPALPQALEDLPRFPGRCKNRFRWHPCRAHPSSP